MTTLLACEKVLYMKKLFILLFDQLQTDGSEGSLWAAHGVADLPVINKELELCFSVLLNYFMNSFLIEIVV